MAGRRQRMVRALGMALSPFSTEQVVEKILAEPVSDGVRLMVTPNLQHVSLLRIPAFAAAYAGAHLVCPDGLPVLIYARLRGLKLRERVTGCEVFARLIRHRDVFRHRIFVVVESRATAIAASAWAARRGMADQLTVAVAPGRLGADAAEQAALVRRIGEAKPNILVMTLGAPVSEVFVHAHQAALPPCWALCVGQALRVELTLARRAPLTWQHLGLEWLWRLGREPKRLVGRYARALVWFPVAILQDLVRPEGRQVGEEVHGPV